VDSWVHCRVINDKAKRKQDRENMIKRQQRGGGVEKDDESRVRNKDRTKAQGESRAGYQLLTAYLLFHGCFCLKATRTNLSPTWTIVIIKSKNMDLQFIVTTLY